MPNDLDPIPGAVERAADRFRARHPAHALIFRLPGRRVLYVPGCPGRSFVKLSAEALASDLLRMGMAVAIVDEVGPGDVPAGAAVARVVTRGEIIDLSPDPTAGKGRADR